MVSKRYMVVGVLALWNHTRRCFMATISYYDHRLYFSQLNSQSTRNEQEAMKEAYRKAHRNKRQKLTKPKESLDDIIDRVAKDIKGKVHYG